VADGCRCDWEKCRKDCDCRCHVGIEAHANHSYKVGQYAGLNSASAMLLQQAGDSFTKGRDQEAQLLRFWAERMKQEAEDIHPGPRPKFETIRRV
jgi:hypothetical protein